MTVRTDIFLYTEKLSYVYVYVYIFIYSYIVIIRALSASSIGLLLEISSPTYLNILLYYQVHSSPYIHTYKHYIGTTFNMIMIAIGMIMILMRTTKTITKVLN